MVQVLHNKRGTGGGCDSQEYISRLQTLSGEPHCPTVSHQLRAAALLAGFVAPLDRLPPVLWTERSEQGGGVICTMKVFGPPL